MVEPLCTGTKNRLIRFFIHKALIYILEVGAFTINIGVHPSMPINI
jgi:hypothetical protein